MRASRLAVPGGRAIWTAARATAWTVIRPARSMKTVAASLTLTSGIDSSSRPSRRPNSWCGSQTALRRRAEPFVSGDLSIRDDQRREDMKIAAPQAIDPDQTVFLSNGES